MTPEQLVRRLVEAERSAGPAASSTRAGWERLVSADLSKALAPAATGAPLGGGLLVGLAKGVAIGVGIGSVALGGAAAAGLIELPTHSAHLDGVAVHSSAAGRGSPQPTDHREPSVESARASNPLSSARPMSPTPLGPVPPLPAHGQGLTPPPEESETALVVDAGTLESETALLRRAKAALDAGQVLVAEVWLQEHASRFPSGALGVEREGLLVLSGCIAGRLGATQRAAAFIARNPTTLLAGRLNRHCSGLGSAGALPDE